MEMSFDMDLYVYYQGDLVKFYLLIISVKM